jgi:hypothetical protein
MAEAEAVQLEARFTKRYDQWVYSEVTSALLTRGLV